LYSYTYSDYGAFRTAWNTSNAARNSAAAFYVDYFNYSTNASYGWGDYYPGYPIAWLAAEFAAVFEPLYLTGDNGVRAYGFAAGAEALIYDFESYEGANSAATLFSVIQNWLSLSTTRYNAMSTTQKAAWENLFGSYSEIIGTLNAAFAALQDEVNNRPAMPLYDAAAAQLALVYNIYWYEYSQPGYQVKLASAFFWAQELVTAALNSAVPQEAVRAQSLVATLATRRTQVTSDPDSFKDTSALFFDNVVRALVLAKDHQIYIVGDDLGVTLTSVLAAMEQPGITNKDRTMWTNYFQAIFDALASTVPGGVTPPATGGLSTEELAQAIALAKAFYDGFMYNEFIIADSGWTINLKTVYTQYVALKALYDNMSSAQKASVVNLNNSYTLTVSEIMDFDTYGSLSYYLDYITTYTFNDQEYELLSLFAMAWGLLDLYEYTPIPYYENKVIAAVTAAQTAYASATYIQTANEDLFEFENEDAGYIQYYL
jgi:hypothetical protein